MSGSLEVPIRPRRGGRSRWWRVLAVLGALLLVAGWAFWYATSPDELPVDDRRFTESRAVGEPVYVGMFTPPAGYDRTLHLSDVSVPTDGGGAATPFVCRDGAFGVTSDPEQFCSDLVEPEGAELGPSDSIVVEVSSDVPAVVTVGRLELSFRDGLTWGTDEAGNAGAEITFVARPSPGDAG